MGRTECKYGDSCGYDLCVPEFCKEYEQKPMTNADRIRAMSDEELAEWIVTTGTICDCCIVQTACAEDIRYEDCKNNVTKWLQQPVKEGADHA